MPDYKLTQAEYRRLKSRLTRCLNKKQEDPEKLLKETTAALDRFKVVGFPDDWARWERAQEDAKWLVHRNKQPPGIYTR